MRSADTGPAPQQLVVVSADMGEGHNATGRALSDAARGLWPGLEVTWVDVLDAMSFGAGPILRRLYSDNVQHTPWLYEFFYAQLVRHRGFADWSKHLIGAWAGRRLAPEIAGARPELIVSTYPMGTAGLAWLRRHRALEVPIGAWVSDFAPHPFWVFGEADLTLLMHEVAVPVGRQLVPEARLGVSAPPVRPDFAPGDREPARQALRLPQGAFVGVISCGALAFGDVVSAARAVLEADPSTIAVAVCGRNEGLRRRLLQEGDRRGRLRALGWVDDMPLLTRAADVVVTNAGGATSLETLACGRTLLMYRPIAAHGKANARLMAEAGLAEVCLSAPQLEAAVRRLRQERGLQGARELAALAYTRRRTVADGLLQLWQARRPEASPAPAGD